VTAIVVYALIGFVVVPWIAKGMVIPKVAEQLDAEVTVGKIRCNPFTLSLTIEGLSVPDRSGAPMLSLDRMYANLQASSLIRWALVLKELRVENPYVAIRRLPDGGINLLEVIQAFESEEPLVEEDRGLPRAVLQSIRMSDGRFELEDQAREEPLIWQAGPSQLHLDNISTLPGDQGGNEFVIVLPQGGTIEINGDVVVDPLGLDGSLEFDKLVLTAVWPLIGNKFEFDLAGGNLSAELEYHVRLQDGELLLQMDGADFQLADLDLRTRQDNAEIATLSSVTVSGVEAAWPEQTVRAESLIVDGASAHVWLAPDGRPSWADLVPRETQEQIVETYRTVQDKIDVDARLGRFELRDASASFEDRTFDEPHRIELVDAALSLTDVSSEPGSQWGLEASAGIGADSRASARGTFVAAPVTLDAEVRLENLELSPFQDYVEKAAPLELLAGVVSSAGKVRLAPADKEGQIRFQGDLSVQGLDLDETVTGGTLLGWGDLKVTGIDARLAPMSLEVDKADVYTAGLEIAVAEDGTINLLQFTKALGAGKRGGEGQREASAETSAPAEPNKMPPARIGAVELHDCYGVYKDATTPTAFERKLDSINGTVSNITTTGQDTATLDIGAAIDSGGAVSVTGEMDILEYARSTDLTVDIREVHLPPMSPMSIKIIGYPIEGGLASLDLEVDITDYQLQAANHVEVNRLQLGEKVTGEGKIDAPIKLGVSMLKDKNGQITLDIPMEGDLRDPEFVVASAVSAAVAGVMGSLVKSPFRMLGRLAGGSDEQDLEFVEFELGSATLEPHVVTNLATLAKGLEDRPELSLEIAGAYDPQADTTGLREAALYQELGGDVSAGSLESLPIRWLESRFEAQTSPSHAAMVRGRYMSEDGSVDEQGLRAELLNELLAAQEVSDADVQALAPARAEAIRSFLVDQQGVDAASVVVRPDPVTVEDGEDKIRLRLSLTTD
jgi:hypothetical protein